MALEGPQFVPVALTLSQRRFLLQRWEGFAIAVLYHQADEYMASVFDEWLKHFPVPSYTESDDPDEQECIAKVVKKGMRNYLRWILWSKDKVYQDWQDEIKKKLGH